MKPKGDDYSDQILSELMRSVVDDDFYQERETLDEYLRKNVQPRKEIKML